MSSSDDDREQTVQMLDVLLNEVLGHSGTKGLLEESRQKRT